MDEVVLGSPVTLRYELDKDGAPQDPARLTLQVRHRTVGDLTIAPWTGSNGDIIKDSTGRFHAEVAPARPGLHVYRWAAFDGSDKPIGAAEGEFIVFTRMA